MMMNSQEITENHTNLLNLRSIETVRVYVFLSSGELGKNGYDFDLLERERES
jgi:hypothetical protein